MKVNMLILKEVLSDYVFESLLKQNYCLSLSRARRFTDFPTDDDIPRGVYVLSENDLCTILKTHPNDICSVIYCGSSPIAELPFSNVIDIIHVSERLSPEDAYSMVMDCFETLSNWHDELLLAITTNPNIKAVLEIAARPLDNPIVLVDPFGTCIEWAGQFPPGSFDFVWRTIFEKGRAFGPEQGPIFETDVERSGAKFTLLKGVSRKYPKEGLIVDIYDNPSAGYGRHVIGSIGSTTVTSKPYSGREISLLIEIADCLGGFQGHSRRYLHKRENSFASVAKSILSGEKVSPFRVNSLLNSNLVDIPHFWLFVIDLTNVSIDGKHSSLQKNLYNTYLGLARKAATPKQTVLLFSGCIVIINQNVEDITAIAKSTLDRLKDLFAPVSIKIGISNEFSSYFELRSAFEQAACILRIGCLMNPDNDIFDFNDYSIEYLLDNSSIASSPKLICCTAANLLFEHDSSHGTDYLMIAESYCKHGGNKAKIADELFMHRNTLNYRLEKMKSIVDISKMDAESRLNFLISCRVLRWKSLEVTQIR